MMSQPSKIEFCDLKSQQSLIRSRLDAAMARVLDHGMYINGPEVTALEQQLAAFCGAKHAIACSSGTDALLIGLMAKGVGPGQAVLCPDFTFTATPESIALLGASPVFVDVDPATFNLDPAALDAGLKAARAAGLTPAGIIAVDLFGLPADYEAISAFAAREGLFVIADAAQSFGSRTRERAVGAMAEITATSFYPAKPLGCYGDGGAIFTDDDDLNALMRSIRIHGQGAGRYDIDRLGINGRLDTLQAAVLLEKLAIFPAEIESRMAIAARYTAALSPYVDTPVLARGVTSVWAQYTIKAPAGERARIIAGLTQQAIPTQVYYPRPLHRQPAYACYPNAHKADSPSAAEALSQVVMSLPMHPYLTPQQQDRVTRAVIALIEPARIAKTA